MLIRRLRFPKTLFTCSIASDVRIQHYDVIVVGGGHAGTEAVAAASRVGAKTVLITQKIQTIGVLSCNPSLGGVGKGHLVKEIDALDGVMGRAGDWAGIHFSILNRSKGPAVWGPRAQLDRQRYKDFVQVPFSLYYKKLLSTPRVTILEGSVQDLLITLADPEKPGKHKVYGIRLAHGGEIHSRSVVLTTGTFLSGALFMGQNTSPGGRMGDPPSCAGLSNTLKEVLGLRIGRLRTGTPPRIIKNTIDFSLTDIRLPDSSPTPFSFINTSTHCKPEEQLPCYLTYTTPGVEKVVKDSSHLNSHIQQDTKGPRYCPSIESKVLRFPGRQHQVWLEPEGLTSDLMYPQGLSMTMSPEKQLCLIREIPGLQRAKIHTPGYGVQYDFVCPTQLFPWLEVKITQGLFLAGQINGTTGYEEAAAQGLWAGINAGRTSLSMPPLSLSRTQSYIGVLIDDLVGRGVTEPYRMFTSRAEFRTSLRPDNADLRLTLRGFEEVGCVSEQRYNETLRVQAGLNEALSALQSISLSAARWRDKLGDVNITLYRPHCDKQRREMERMQVEESLSLPQDIDYLTLPVSLSQEVREILDAMRPSTLGAATRLPGITPAAIVHLFNYVHRNKHRTNGKTGV
ncbi:MTO1 mitochondrial [Labeo rohita]|uniref:5-taurinomethyluridine-[tRNA] synthase subunit MTO1, mitochondrial n=1 Tax=Labeo rohita TaxID=84645 RepID=A0A498LG60_LABRO|nr:MTO1 mitochondrial [Labeo rohita]RXN16036.1 MTO1 mitochondrial [Labeo rohita]